MLRLYITIDTEYSSRLHRLAPDAGMEENYDCSIRGTASGGEVGIHYQMDVLEGHGLKRVFFVDPMPAFIWGTQAIAAIELMSRDRRRINRIVKHRFEQVCAGIAAMPGVATGTYSNNPPAVRSAPSSSLLPHSYVRTASRVGEQLVINALYGRS